MGYFKNLWIERQNEIIQLDDIKTTREEILIAVCEELGIKDKFQKDLYKEVLFDTSKEEIPLLLENIEEYNKRVAALETEVSEQLRELDEKISSNSYEIEL